MASESDQFVDFLAEHLCDIDQEAVQAGTGAAGAGRVGGIGDRLDWKNGRREMTNYKHDLNGQRGVTCILGAARLPHWVIPGDALGSSGLEPLHEQYVDLLGVLDDEVDQLAGCRWTKVPPTHGAVGIGLVMRWTGPGRQLKDAGDLA